MQAQISDAQGFRGTGLTSQPNTVHPAHDYRYGDMLSPFPAVSLEEHNSASLGE
jgi:hypothetical protein